jgi:uncharacterized protein YjiS (DUF1127 family)
MAHAMTTKTLTQLTASPTLPLIATFAVRFAGLVTQWDKRSRTRRTLKTLDAYMLEDIGVTYALARKEAARAFWQG